MCQERKFWLFPFKDSHFLTKIKKKIKNYLKFLKINSFSQKSFFHALTCLQNRSKLKKSEKNPLKGSKIGTDFFLCLILGHSHWQNCINYCILSITPRELIFFHNVQYIEDYIRLKCLLTYCGSIKPFMNFKTKVRFFRLRA
jgi:hypothetical protein